MIRTLQLALWLSLGILASSTLTAGEHGGSSPKLLTIITSDSNETQAMALILTMHYTRGGGEARILLCDAAGEMAVADSEMGGTVVQPADRSPRQMLQGMINAGVTVEVCAIFLPGQGLEQSALLDGVGVAQPPRIAELMASPDWRLFTF